MLKSLKIYRELFDSEEKIIKYLFYSNIVQVILTAIYLYNQSLICKYLYLAYIIIYIITFKVSRSSYIESLVFSRHQIITIKYAKVIFYTLLSSVYIGIYALALLLLFTVIQLLKRKLN